MGSKYRHFSIEERCEIARRSEAVQSLRQIAAALDRSASSIARELERNTGATGYRSTYAGEKAHARRWRGSRLLRSPELQALVLQLLARGLSPEAVAGRLALEQGQPVISHETIYRFIYARIARTKNYAWRRYLPRGKAKRGFRGRKGGSSALHIAHRVPIGERPAKFSDRSNAGNWEADTMQFAKYGQTVLTLHERASRLLPLPADLVRVLSPQAAALHALAAPYATSSGASAWTTLSVDLAASLAFWLKSCAYACAFFLTLALAPTRERARLIAYMLVLSGLAQAVYGGLMHLSGSDLEIFGTKINHSGQASGGFVNRNHLAGFLEITLAMGIGLMVAACARPGSATGASSGATWRRSRSVRAHRCASSWWRW